LLITALATHARALLHANDTHEPLGWRRSNVLSVLTAALHAHGDERAPDEAARAAGWADEIATRHVKPEHREAFLRAALLDLPGPLRPGPPAV
ncbi:hypothetical protein, partial [Deinococcus pimensis]|uniref:hypothetical protein n=1 Tax=Deinococcus pimensis TaxID=309888 RepID=UPI0005EBCA9A